MKHTGGERATSVAGTAQHALGDGTSLQRAVGGPAGGSNQLAAETVGDVASQAQGRAMRMPLAAAGPVKLRGGRDLPSVR
jgi:hypothetical protein